MMPLIQKKMTHLSPEMQFLKLSATTSAGDLFKRVSLQ
ncbi:hypothetical protein D083_4386 [Dickeya solani RNS 08.23.3.1.A]|nr:hypothetical protein D083_4386 [Dickeya solani RNS 08.23.3.1.A]